MENASERGKPFLGEDRREMRSVFCYLLWWCPVSCYWIIRSCTCWSSGVCTLRVHVHPGRFCTKLYSSFSLYTDVSVANSLGDSRQRNNKWTNNRNWSVRSVPLTSDTQFDGRVTGQQVWTKFGQLCSMAFRVSCTDLDTTSYWWRDNSWTSLRLKPSISFRKVWPYQLYFRSTFIYFCLMLSAYRLEKDRWLVLLLLLEDILKWYALLTHKTFSNTCFRVLLSALHSRLGD